MIKGLAEGLLRCAYCHGGAEGLLEGCKCGVLLHADCRQTLGRCPTLGCQTLSVQAVSVLSRAGEADSAVLWRLTKRWWRATRGYLLTGTVTLVMLGGCLVSASATTRCGPGRSVEGLQRAESIGIKAACYDYRGTVGRWPTSLDQLVAADTTGNPYIEASFLNGDSRDWRYSLMWRGQEAWLAVETKWEEELTIKLVRRLFIREVAMRSVDPEDADDIRR
ncbi:MAG: hypothetical protein JKY65_28915 [Planctomycetes bacterium]|nr:hypothetical protein [Planctomycetota bacterium]